MGKNNPHDTFAREFLSYKQNAVDFFKGILPEKIARNLDLQTLAEDKNNYTDEKLHQYF
ncbi:MAG: transposase, partial [Spirochaetes bacterium]